jgi:hypothetical protein
MLYCQASYVDRAAAGGQFYECDVDVFEAKLMVQLMQWCLPPKPTGDGG